MNKIIGAVVATCVSIVVLFFLAVLVTAWI